MQMFSFHPAFHFIPQAALFSHNKPTIERSALLKALYATQLSLPPLFPPQLPCYFLLLITSTLTYKHVRNLPSIMNVFTTPCFSLSVTHKGPYRPNKTQWDRCNMKRQHQQHRAHGSHMVHKFIFTQDAEV